MSDQLPLGKSMPTPKSKKPLRTKVNTVGSLKHKIARYLARTLQYLVEIIDKLVKSSMNVMKIVKTPKLTSSLILSSVEPYQVLLKVIVNSFVCLLQGHFRDDLRPGWFNSV